MNNRFLGKEELSKLYKMIVRAREYGLTNEARDQSVTDFCAGCPDPAGAYWLMTECLDPMTDEELIDRALKMPECSISSVPISIVPAEHPARN